MGKVSKWIKFSNPVELDRLALLSAVRTIAAAMIPLVLAALAGQPGFGLLMALAGLNISRTDPGGPYRSVALAMSVATLGVALSAFIATWVAGSGWWIVPLLFVWAFGNGFAGGFGNTASIVSFGYVQIFVIAVGLPGGGLAAAPERFVACIAGGLWSMALALWLWPLRPYRPVKDSVLTYYQAVTGFIAEIGRTGEDDSTGALTAKRAAASAARQTAIDFLIKARAANQGASRLSRNLLALTVNAGELFDTAVRLSHELEFAANNQQLYEQARPLIEAAVRELAVVSGQLTENIRQEQGELDLDALDRAISEFDRQVTQLRLNSTDLAADYTGLVDFRNAVHAMQNMAEIVRTAGEIAQDLDESTAGKLPSYTGHQFERRGLGEWLERARDNLTLNSLVFRHALRLGLATALGGAIYLALNLNHGYWITLTLIVILKPDFGGTFERTYYRVLGTVVGGAAGAVLAATVHFEPLIYLIMAVLGVLAFAQLPNHYGLFVVLLTPFVILMIDLSQPGNWEVAAVRILNTIIGGVVALAASYILLPGWQRRFLPEQLARTIEANRDYFREVLAVYLGQPLDPPRLLKAREQAHIETANAETAFQRLLSEPKRQQANVTSFYALVTYNRHFLDSVTTMAAHLGDFSGQHQLAGLADYARRIEQILGELAEAVRRGEQPGQPPALDESVQAIHAAMGKLSSRRLAELSTDRTQTTLTPNRQAIFDFAAVTRVLERLSQDVTMMYREQNQISSSQ